MRIHIWRAWSIVPQHPFALQKKDELSKIPSSWPIQSHSPKLDHYSKLCELCNLKDSESNMKWKHESSSHSLTLPCSEAPSLSHNPSGHDPRALLSKDLELPGFQSWSGPPLFKPKLPGPMDGITQDLHKRTGYWKTMMNQNNHQRLNQPLNSKVVYPCHTRDLYIPSFQIHFHLNGILSSEQEAKDCHMPISGKGPKTPNFGPRSSCRSKFPTVPSVGGFRLLYTYIYILSVYIYYQYSIYQNSIYIYISVYYKKWCSNEKLINK